MWAFVRMVSGRSVICIALTVLATSALPAAGQDAPSTDPSATPREQKLRDQLRNILHELDEIQQQKERAVPEEERPSIIKEQAEPETASGGETAAVPHFDLADMSIVSKRVQKRPEGISLGWRLRGRMPARMRPSLASLDGLR